MLRKIALAFALSLIASTSWATCGAIPLTIKDAANATQSLSSATAADGNCKTYIDADTSSQIHNDLMSPSVLGSASGGLSTSNQSALSNTAVALDASPGQLYVLYCYNPNASVAYLQLFDVAQGSVTVGTTAPAKGSYGIPPSSVSGQAISLVGKQFATAITAAATTTPTGGTAPGSALNCVFDFK